MNRHSFFTFQALVFGLVAAALTTVYITQPVLPVIQQEFGVSPSQASYTVSAVILGIALANLPFGMLADRFPVQRLILAVRWWRPAVFFALRPPASPSWWGPGSSRGCLCPP
jgi:MFS family permease